VTVKQINIKVWGLSIMTHIHKNLGDRAFYRNLPEINIVTKIPKSLGEQREECSESANAGRYR